MGKQETPWPDIATARFFLAGFFDEKVAEQFVSNFASELDAAKLGKWVIEREIAGVAWRVYGRLWPSLSRILQPEVYGAIAEGVMHEQWITRFAQSFHEAGIKVVLLKGAALAQTAYGDRTLRTMSDIDFWVASEQMETAVRQAIKLGFVIQTSEKRPLALQKLSHGEIQLYQHKPAQRLIELHWSAFPGWWLKRVAAVDNEEIWGRLQVLKSPVGAYTLQTEDTIIQLAVHQAVNHQFGLKGLQGLLDIAMLLQQQEVAWDVVTERAARWRVQTSLYLVLFLVNELWSEVDLAKICQQIRPPRWQSRFLARFVSLDAILQGQNLQPSKWRYMLLLLLTDRLRDAGKLMFRTLWPEPEWLLGRYGRSVSHWRHLWTMLRQPAVQGKGGRVAS